MSLVINLFGGPGSRKTTLAAGIFVELKKLGLDAEIVSEFAKDLILEGKADALAHQWFVMANQTYRIQQAAKHFQFVITDSPILQGVVYDADRSPALRALCVEHHHRHRSLNYLMVMPYGVHSMAGRVHDRTESLQKHEEIATLLEEHKITHVVSVSADDVQWAVDDILRFRADSLTSVDPVA